MPEITLTIKADNAASPTIQEVKADFKGLGEEIASAMEKSSRDAQSSGLKIGAALKSGLGIALDAVLAIPKVIGGVFSTVTGIVGGVLNGLIAIVKGVVGAIVSAFEVLPKALGLVFNKVTALATAAFGFIVVKLGAAGAEAEALGLALERLARKAGTSSTAIVTAIQRGSGGTIPRLAAMKIANEALLAGVAKTPEQFEKLAELADILSDAIGGDAAEAFATLTRGISVGNDRLLESIGIHLEAEAAFEQMALTLGKEAAALTEAEKAQALLNQVLEQTSGLVRESAGGVDLLGDKFDRLKTAFKDAFADLGGVVGPALGLVADALDPIVRRMGEWLAANRDLLASRVSDFAESLAAGIERVAARLPDIVEAVGGGLKTGFELARRAAEIAWVGITAGIAAVVREFEVFKLAVVDFLEGRGFDPTGSALLAGFRVLKAQVKLLALEAASAFTDSFGESAAAVADFVRELENKLITARQIFVGLQGDFERGIIFRDIGPEGQAIDRRTQEEVNRLEQLKRHAPVTPERLSRGLEESRGQAEAELADALEAFEPIAADIDARGAELRERVSSKIEALRSSVANYFAADEQGRERELQATEDANAAVVEAVQVTQQVTEAVVQEQKRQKRTAEELKARADELLRQMRAAAGQAGVPVVTASG